MYRAHSLLLKVKRPQKLKKIIQSSGFAFILAMMANSAFAGQGNQSASIFLKSCKIDIRADKVYNRSGSIDYYGNVQFLYGLANVRTDRVTLIKNKDGSCKLVANQWAMKNNNQ